MDSENTSFQMPVMPAGYGYGGNGGFGNFGNVYTETAYRRLGLLGELMAPCMADFDAALEDYASRCRRFGGV